MVWQYFMQFWKTIFKKIIRQILPCQYGQTRLKPGLLKTNQTKDCQCKVYLNNKSIKYKMKKINFKSVFVLWPIQNGPVSKQFCRNTVHEEWFWLWCDRDRHYVTSLTGVVFDRYMSWQTFRHAKMRSTACIVYTLSCTRAHFAIQTLPGITFLSPFEFQSFSAKWFHQIECQVVSSRSGHGVSTLYATE